MNFIIALGQCVLAGGFAQWYFTYQKEVTELSSPYEIFLVVIMLCFYLWYGKWNMIMTTTMKILTTTMMKS